MYFNSTRIDRAVLIWSREELRKLCFDYSWINIVVNEGGVSNLVLGYAHCVVNEGGVNSLVLGYAHRGMVAAARWISKLAISCLTKALTEHPSYKVKVVGHSLGGAPCMTWELVESDNSFITSVINGADLVPTFSAAYVDDLLAEVRTSAWLNDLRNQIERTRILNIVYRSANSLGFSPSIHCQC